VVYQGSFVIYQTECGISTIYKLHRLLKLACARFGGQRIYNADELPAYDLLAREILICDRASGVMASGYLPIIHKRGTSL